MSSKMDVDSSSAGRDHGDKKVDVHPLAVVHMSDQYTRVVTGGSLLNTTAPVVGLLFGTCTPVDPVKKRDGTMTETSNIDYLQVFDADDIPIDASEASTKQIELHQAVFPQHRVVGWYRVSKDDEPNQEDLSTTKLLQNQYCQEEMQDASGTEPKKPFVFCLLHVRSPNEGKDKEQNSLSDDLPISLYELHSEGGSPVLLGIDGWQLNTSESERIAVERVIREQPQHQAQVQQVATKETKKKGKKSAKGDNSEAEGAAVEQKTQSAYVSQTQSVKQSLSAMKDRIEVLAEFLEQTKSGKIPPNPSLLRRVQGLLYSLGPLAAQTPSSSAVASSAAPDPSKEDAVLLSHLAMVTKTISVVQSYTEKFRLVQENRPSSSKDTMRRMV